MRSAEALSWPLNKVGLVLAGYGWETKDDIKYAKEKGYGVIEDNCTDLTVFLPLGFSEPSVFAFWHVDLTPAAPSL